VIQTQRRRLQVLLRPLTSSLCPQVPHGETRSRKTRSSSKVRGEDAMAPEKEVDPGFFIPPKFRSPKKRPETLRCSRLDIPCRGPGVRYAVDGSHCHHGHQHRVASGDVSFQDTGLAERPRCKMGSLLVRTDSAGWGAAGSDPSTGTNLLSHVYEMSCTRSTTRFPKTDFCT
jgi:hypothetical protein